MWALTEAVRVQLLLQHTVCGCPMLRTVERRNEIAANQRLFGPSISEAKYRD